MINRIKNMMGPNPEELIVLLKDMRSQINQVTSAVENLAEQVTGAQQQLAGLNSEISHIRNTFEKECISIAESRDTLTHSIKDLDIVKGQLANKVANQLINRFHSELIASTERLRSDVRTYNDLKDELRLINTELRDVRQEIAKLKEISGLIEKRDFELTQFEKRLTSTDREKVKLLKQVDELKSIIARQRQRQKRSH